MLIVSLVVIRHLNKLFFVQTLVRFFQADGEGLLLEDLKSGDYKVFSPSINVAGQNELSMASSSFPLPTH